MTFLWGGYSVANPTLNRFFSLHYLLPFMIAGVVVLHIWALHIPGSNNPGRRRDEDREGHAALPPLLHRQGCLRARRLPDDVRVVRLLPAELSRPRRQLHRGQPGRDAGAHRAGVVLPALLRDPARHPGQAPGRHRHVRLDRDPGVPALARHVAGEVGGLPPALPPVLLGLRHRLRRARLARLQAAGGGLHPRGPYLHGLLLRALPDHPAAARSLRDAAPHPGLDRGSSARKGRRLCLRHGRRRDPPRRTPRADRDARGLHHVEFHDDQPVPGPGRRA